MMGTLSGCGGHRSTRVAYLRRMTGVPVRPKSKCCVSKPRCKRCPIRLLSEGKLSSAETKKIFAGGRNRKALKKARLDKAA